MVHRYDLSTLTWTLVGHTPSASELGRAPALGLRLNPEVPAVAVTIPGSVQNALLAAGVIPDWHIGLNTRACEWVENREWIYETILPNAWCVAPGTKQLFCKGLDGIGVVVCNGQVTGRFNNSFMPFTFDLTPLLGETDNRLQIIFEADLPRKLGMGHSSRISPTKPRFNYTWDWQPRLVQVGVWDGIELHTAEGAKIDSLRCYTDYDPQTERGSLHWRVETKSAATSTVCITILDGAGSVLLESIAPVSDTFAAIDDLQVDPWWPSGLGAQTRYKVQCQLFNTAGLVLDEAERHIGFRRVTWRACDNAPPNADPWICVVNDKPVFLRGVNWTPVRGNFADVTTDMVRQRVELYRDLNMNMLRVWGGAVLERADFFDVCDELGLMVWQEFPLSSSGIDNSPPYDQANQDTLAAIAESYVARRQHHPSLIIWCGGNELQTADQARNAEGIGRPWDNTHPILARFGRIVAQQDPLRRYLPTSSTGPRFEAKAENFGKGEHWDVHGPWRAPCANEAASRDYWANDDALFRSETGCGGAADADMIRKYAGDLPTLPATADSQLYRRFAWWIDWQDVTDSLGHEPRDLDEYVKQSQQLQATYVRMAATRCLERFPACGGILMWMGHDAFPCPVNTSIVDYEGKPKPAALALRDVFQHADKTSKDE